MSSTDPTDNPLHAVATEFVTEEFDTRVTDAAVAELATAVEERVQALRARLTSDDRLEALLRSQPGGTVLTSNDSTENEDPEPLTQRTLIEPLLAVLGYPDPSVEAGDLSDEYGQQADYSVSLRDDDDIDSERLLIEAEPLNKALDKEDHGIGQVEDWLEKRHFAADFGIATDGVRWVLIKYDPDTYSYDTLAEVDLQPLYLAAFENVTGRQVSLEQWLDDTTETVATEFWKTFGYENFRSIAGEARDVIKARKEAITDEFYDDYVRLVFGIYDDAADAETARSLVGDGIIAPDDATGDDVRLFAVELMNRLIFIKFLEDKGLVEETLLQDLVDAYEDAPVPERFYKAYLEPLFFGVLDEEPDDRPTRVRQMALFEDVPYLNGGLFRPGTEDEQGFHDRDFDVRDSVLLAIIELLERYSFSADGGPTDLDPSVLGNVFEKTINHITTDSADTQKELGAYYTPDEITRFCAEETVQPALRERFGEVLVAEWGWTDAMIAEYDDVYALIEALPPNVDLVEDLLDVVDHFRALDPACGSGHFLTSVQSEIVGIRKALYEQHADDPADWELHKQTVIQNIYGVDIVAPAVEIAKLRLWLSIIAEVDPGSVAEYDEAELALPNVVFNVRQGNSLIGYTELMETTGDGDQAQLQSWGADSVRAKYGEIIDAVEEHKQATETQDATEYLQQAERLLDEYRSDLDEKVLEEFHQTGISDITIDDVRKYEPFHWVLEFAVVYADGGFDVIVGNPPWEVLSSNREEYFSRYDPEFRTRPDSEKNTIQNELLEKDDIALGWENHQKRMDILSTYFKDSPSYQLQSPDVGGQAKSDLSMLFLERVLDLTNNEGYTAQVLPGKLFVGTGNKDLRDALLSDTQLKDIIGFKNKGIFKDIDNRYKFGIVTFKNEGETEFVRARFKATDLKVIQDINESTFRVPISLLRQYSPNTLIFPQVSEKQEVNLLEKIVHHKPIADRRADEWYIDFYREELNRTRDSDRFVEDPDQGDYPVYGGENIWQFVYNSNLDLFSVTEPEFWSVEEEANPDKSAKRRIREKNLRRLKKEIYDAFDGSGSQIGFVNDLLEENRRKPLSSDDVRLDCTEYRIGFRHISRSSDERSFIAAILPPGIVCHDKCPTIRPFEIVPKEKHLSSSPLHDMYQRIFSDRELFVALGLLDSIPFDYIIRTKVDTSLSLTMLGECQLPRLTEGDNWFEYIWTRAARLNCYGEAFAEMRERLDGIDPATDMAERKRLQAEIDAAAFHAYGLDREETQFVLDDFHRVQNPRIMTEDYFELVPEKYDDLAETGPME